jgi:putative SbcD/Mre11-related phosphoesterase
MNRSRLELFPGFWLDARRAVWIEQERALLVADLHVGYAWAHRQQGNLMPINGADDTLDRLHALALEYDPREIIVLGDIVHAAVAEETVLADLRRLSQLGAVVSLILGNHDRQLAPMLKRAGIDAVLRHEIELGGHLLLHGDFGDEDLAEDCCVSIAAHGGRVILGHEHPAISLSDGFVTRLHCPCFLLGDDVLALPAFSRWSAGTNVRDGVFLSPYLRRANLTHTIAIVADRLLPIPFRN